MKPTTEHNAAGSLIDPAVSDPSEPRAIPLETDAAEPPDEPPGIADKFHGYADN